MWTRVEHENPLQLILVKCPLETIITMGQWWLEARSAEAWVTGTRECRWEWWQSPPLGSVHTWHGDHWPLTSTGPGFVTLSRRGLTSLLVTTWQWFHSLNWCLDNVDCQLSDSSPSASFLNVICINVYCVKSLENNSLSWWTYLQIF